MSPYTLHHFVEYTNPWLLRTAHIALIMYQVLCCFCVWQIYFLLPFFVLSLLVHLLVLCTRRLSQSRQITPYTSQCLHVVSSYLVALCIKTSATTASWSQVAICADSPRAYDTPTTPRFSNPDYKKISTSGGANTSVSPECTLQTRTPQSFVPVMR